MEEILSIQHLCKTIKYDTGLNDCNICLYEGMILGILGHRSAEKELLLDILSGNDSFDSGTVFLNENLLFGNVLDSKGQIAFVHNPQLIPEMTVMENLYYVGEPARFDFFTKNRRQTDETLSLSKRFNLDIAPDDSVRNLKEEDQLIIMILKAYVHGAKVMLIDDAGTRITAFSDKVKAFFYALMAEGISFIMTSSQYSELSQLTAHILFMVTGHLKKNYFKTFPNVVKNKTLEDARDFNLAHKSANKERILEAKCILTEPDIDLSFSLLENEVLLILDFDGNTCQNLYNYLLHPDISIYGNLLYKGFPLMEDTRCSDFYFEDFSIDDLSIIKTLPLQDNLTLMDKERFESIGFIKHKTLAFVRDRFLQWYPSYSVPKEKDCIKCTTKDILAIKLYRAIIHNPKVFICINPNYGFWADDILIIKDTIEVLQSHGTSVIILSNGTEVPRTIGNMNHILCVEGGRILN